MTLSLRAKCPWALPRAKGKGGLPAMAVGRDGDGRGGGYAIVTVTCHGLWPRKADSHSVWLCGFSPPGGRGFYELAVESWGLVWYNLGMCDHLSHYILSEERAYAYSNDGAIYGWPMLQDAQPKCNRNYTW